jgi:hypothetical protein
MKKRMIPTLLLILITQAACEQADKRIAEEMIRIKQAHTAILESAADHFIALQSAGRLDEAQSFRLKVITIDDKIRVTQREAAEALLTYVAVKNAQNRLLLVQKIAIVAALVEQLISEVKNEQDGNGNRIHQRDPGVSGKPGGAF